MDVNQEMEAEIVDDGDDHWEHSRIQLLLRMYQENIDKFRNPKMRKKNVWTEIGNAVGIVPEGCDKKFRNLKQTYIRLLKKKNRNGIATFKWPYFDIFEEIYSENGEYHPEIQQKIQDSSKETVANALLTLNAGGKLEPEVTDNGESTCGITDERRKRLLRKRHAEIRKVTMEMADRQRIVEEKLDRLINIVEESNSIQRERNQLFQEFLEKLNQQS